MSSLVIIYDAHASYATSTSLLLMLELDMEHLGLHSSFGEWDGRILKGVGLGKGAVRLLKRVN